MGCQPRPGRNTRMFETLSIIEQAVRTVRTAGKPSRESGKLPACGSRNGASPAPQEQHSPIRSRADYLTHAVGDIFFPTAPEFSGCISGCSSEQRSILHAAFVLTVAKEKRDRNQGKPSKTRSCKAFQFCKGFLFLENGRKRRPMPTGEVRLSEQTL